MLTYNRASYIKEAIESVCVQTYENWELIILDDGSTDTTKDIVSAINDPRVRYIQNKDNKGLMIRRSESIRYTEGTYITILDSDDIWTDPTKLETQVAFLEEKRDCVLVGTFITRINDAGTIIGQTTYEVTDSAIRNKLLLQNQFAHSSVLMRKDAVATVGGYRPLPFAEDYDLFLRLGKIGQLANISKYMTAYRVHNKGVSTQRRLMARAIQEIIFIHKDSYPHYAAALLKSYVRIWMSYF